MTRPLREELERWGFSDAEVDVYLAVLDVGQGRASEVAERADVSTRHVYRITDRLEDLGLVTVDEHVQPTTVRATPPEEVGSVLNRSRERLVAEIEDRYDEPPERPVDVDLLKRQPTVLDRGRSMIDDAERWVILVAPRDLLELFAEELREAVERGVLVLVLTEDAPLAGTGPIEDLGTVVRVREDVEAFDDFGLGVDDYRSLIVTPDASASDSERYSPALYLEEENITTRINRSLIEDEWRLGEEHVLPEPAELPHTFGVFPKALVHAALHEREGRSLRATAEAHPIDDANWADGARPRDDEALETVSGDVVDVRQGLVEPHEKSFLFEQAMALETDDGRVTLGGPGATIEDYGVHELRLERADDEGRPGTRDRDSDQSP